MQDWQPRRGGWRSRARERQRRRRRILLAVVAIAFLLLAAGQVFTPDDLPRLVQRLQPGVVTVMVYQDPDRRTLLAQGTGFFISPTGHLVTNHHVLAKGRLAEVKTLEGRRYLVKGVLAADREGDLVVAAIHPPPEGVSFLSLSGTAPRVGERVLVMGTPLGLEQTLSDGVVSALRFYPQGPLVQITAPISPGSSGSPVINMQGEVIGLASGTLTEAQGQNLNFAIPGQRILTLKEKAAAARTAPSPLASLAASAGPGGGPRRFGR